MKSPNNTEERECVSATPKRGMCITRVGLTILPFFSMMDESDKMGEEHWHVRA